MRIVLWLIGVIIFKGSVFSQDELLIKQNQLDSLRTEEKELLSQIEVLKLRNSFKSYEILGVSYFFKRFRNS